MSVPPVSSPPFQWPPTPEELFSVMPAYTERSLKWLSGINGLIPPGYFTALLVDREIKVLITTREGEYLAASAKIVDEEFEILFPKGEYPCKGPSINKALDQSGWNLNELQEDVIGEAIEWIVVNITQHPSYTPCAEEEIYQTLENRELQLQNMLAFCDELSCFVLYNTQHNPETGILEIARFPIRLEWSEESVEIHLFQDETGSAFVYQNIDEMLDDLSIVLSDDEL